MTRVSRVFAIQRQINESGDWTLADKMLNAFEWSDALREGYSAEAVASMAADGFAVPDPPGWEMGPLIDRVPGMYVPPRTIAQKRDAALFAGKPKTEAPRIEIHEGDAVSWAAAGRGIVRRLYEEIDNTLTAEIEVGGVWWIDEYGRFVKTETGKRGTLTVRAADLTRAGEG